MIKIVDGVEVTLTDAEKAEITQRQIDMLPIAKRAERDALLAASDVHALADRITDEWRVYRQALRDLPAQSGFPDVNMPVAPS
jgi:hypothetical protein